jgi:selenide,water dikinase
MGPGDLSVLMRGINYKKDDRVVVGFRDSDDAGAVKIGREIILQTVDIITPIIDDPFTFGQIAAANSLSDIYAMGGVPVSVLNIAAFPVDCLDISILREILEGGRSKIEEAGAVVIGGHTIIDKEIKYGLSVAGSPGRKIFTNKMATPGLDIILTKPIGGGIVSTAVKGEMAKEEHKRAIAESMTRLNKYALEAVDVEDVATMTDVTGFGLLGHLLEVARASNIGISVKMDTVPFMDGFNEYISLGLIPAGAYRNKEFVASNVQSKPENILRLSVPETSGGLLIFCKKEQSGKMLDKIIACGDTKAAIIGQTISYSDKHIIVE